jgi:putative methionine-R-sulfoxide reductase with GAF domain
MLVDETGEQLYTVASTGYGASGAGSEVRIGEGVVGLAAERRLSIRVTNLARERSYTHAARRAAVRSGLIRKGERVIPLPSLPDAQSLMVVPMLGHRKLVGVLGFHSDRAGAFHQEDECAAGILANQVAMAYVAMVDDRREPAPEPPITATAPAGSIEVKHYAEDDSVFLDNEYLIKGVAGAILWKLVTAYQESGRSEFSNKEMRLDPSLDLPDIKDNLEARLILLRKRLEERSFAIRIDKVARGRFRLTVTSALKLVNVAGAGPL